MKLVIVDYDIGNVRSIQNAFGKMGVTPILSRDRDLILNADGVVLPGVGAFAHGMKNLHKYNLVEILKEYAISNKPLLGICLGMQMLLEESEEFGITRGIGLVPGKVIRLPIKDPKYEKLPHVSWNEIIPKFVDWANTIFENIPIKSNMYFVHSFVAVPANKNHILATTTYSGHKFCSSFKKNNIYGCQFHPEKSAGQGLRIIENFLKVINTNINV